MSIITKFADDSHSSFLHQYEAFQIRRISCNLVIGDTLDIKILPDVFILARDLEFPLCQVIEKMHL